MSRPSLDALDQAIIEALRADGRASNRAVAKLLGVSENAVRQRVNRLSDQGVLHVRALVDPRASRMALLHVLVRVRPDLVERVVDAIIGNDKVEFMASGLGRYNLVLGLVGESRSEMAAFISDELRSLDGVVEVRVAEGVEIVKMDARWAKL